MRDDDAVPYDDDGSGVPGGSTRDDMTRDRFGRVYRRGKVGNRVIDGYPAWDEEVPPVFNWLGKAIGLFFLAVLVASCLV